MPSGDSDISTYVDQLRELPFVDEAATTPVPQESSGRRADAAIDVELVDGSTRTLLAWLATSHLDREAASHLRTRLTGEDELWIVLAPYVGGPLGDAFEAKGINFIDQQGNCRVRIGDHFVARVRGRTPPKRPSRDRELRAPGYQVLFAFLAAPELVVATQREIAAEAGTSRQPVADLLSRLVEEKVLVKRGSKHAWVDGPDTRLLSRFLAGYGASLRPRLVVGRYRLPVREPAAVESWLTDRLEAVRFGGTAGAHRLQPHYRGPLTVVHLGPPEDATRRTLKASPSADGELVWMRHIGTASQKGVTEDTEHPLLIYAELMSDPDPRAQEAAELIAERWLPWSH